MIKNKLALITAIFISLTAVSQQKKQAAAPAKQSPHLKVFNLAIASGDATAATTALNYYLSEQGSNNIYGDTLAMLYMQQGAFPQCYYWAQKRLESKPDDNTLLELKGICLDKLQQPKEAIDIFEKLFKKTQSPYHAYKLMELQYSIKRLAECVATATSAERLQYKPDFVMSYNVGDQVGRTYLQAGVYNIHALALYDLDRKAEAKTYLEKAIALDSNFVLARQNLEAIKTAEKGTNKVNPNTSPLNNPANKQN